MRDIDLEKNISFFWDIHYRCNYRCPYCWWYGVWCHLAKLNHYISLKEWLRCWRNLYDIYGPVSIEITGGEPFIYPDFAKLIKELSVMHTFTIHTNLSTDIDDFMKEIDPSKVKIIATFHPLFAKFSNFVKKVLIFKKNGFTNKQGILAYPLYMKQIDYYRDKFKQEGLELSVLAFREEFQINHQQTEENDFMHAVIMPDGKVIRCVDSTFMQIGNLFDKNSKLLDRALICNLDLCRYSQYTFLLRKEVANERVKINNRVLRELTNIGSVDSKAKDNRTTISPYRVNFTWDIHYACNYKCRFCYFNEHLEEISKENRYPGTEKWIQVWDDIYARYGSCHIHISGGEPFIYPDFMALLAYLLENHTVEVDTNLSFNVPHFIKQIKEVEKFRFAATFHPEHADIDSYLEKALKLREAGFDLPSICYVAYPLQLEKMKEYKTQIEEKGFSFLIQPFRGKFDGRPYPQEYTNDEKSLIVRCGPEVTRLMLTWYGEGNNKKVNRSILCRMGQMYAKIRATGNVYRCCWFSEKNKLGNLLEGTFKLLDEPEPCRSDEPCNCYKAMLVGFQEDKWLPLWYMPKDYHEGR